MIEWTLIFAAVVGAGSFCVLFRTPVRYIAHTMAAGTIAALGSQLRPESVPIGLWSFGLAIVLGAFCNLLARQTKLPAQSFLIPGFIVLVPGTYIYRAFTHALASQFESSILMMLAAITITCGITFGLLVASWLVPAGRTL